jgi:hypothetical protein
LLMVSSKDRAYLNVKMADGHMKENGNKARWTSMDSAGG